MFVVVLNTNVLYATVEFHQHDL